MGGGAITRGRYNGTLLATECEQTPPDDRACVLTALLIAEACEQAPARGDSKDVLI